MKHLPIEIGQKFDLLTVEGPTEPYISPKGRKGANWSVRCDCGKVTIVRDCQLKSGKTKSCGCLVLRHGGWQQGQRTPEYLAWCNLKERCQNPNHFAYPNYGGRGISVCEEWQQDFPAFLAHVGPRPSPGHSIDRIDNEGNYAPGNCRWATKTEQAQNRRERGRLIQAYGCNLTAKEWSKKWGVPVSAIYWRLQKGWGVEDALSRPPT